MREQYFWQREKTGSLLDISQYKKRVIYYTCSGDTTDVYLVSVGEHRHVPHLKTYSLFFTIAPHKCKKVNK